MLATAQEIVEKATAQWEAQKESELKLKEMMKLPLLAAEECEDLAPGTTRFVADRGNPKELLKQVDQRYRRYK